MQHYSEPTLPSKTQLPSSSATHRLVSLSKTSDPTYFPHGYYPAATDQGRFYQPEGGTTAISACGIATGWSMTRLRGTMMR